MKRGEARDRNPWPLLSAAFLTVVALGVLLADAQGRGSEPVLAALAPIVEGWISLGAVLDDWAHRFAPRLRVPALGVCTAWLVFHFTRRPTHRTAGQIAASLCLAWIAQAYLLDGRLGAGLTLYVSAAAIYLYGRDGERAAARALGPRLELAAGVAALVVFAVSLFYQLDVYPGPYFDELSYLRAARMQIGEVARGAVFAGLYTLERFQAQFIPLGLQSAAVAALSPGLLAVRLVSVVAASITLLVAVSSLRPWLGQRAVLLMLLLCSVSPLYLTYGRAGLYFGISTLHGAVTFAALLHYCQAQTRRAALLLGALLGLSPFLYQVSWFVPILALMAVVVWWGASWPQHLWRRHLIVGLSALCVVVPIAFLLRAGLADVAAQTFDSRAIWSANERPQGPKDPPGSVESANIGALVAIAQDADEAVLAKTLTSLREQGVRARHAPLAGGYTAMVLAGEADVLAPVLSRWEQESAVVMILRTKRTAWQRAGDMLARLIYAPGWESSGTFSAAPILNPLVAPLIILGLLEAWRSRSSPVMRLLAVWVVATALLPAVLGGAISRRAVLMVPFAYALAALPIVRLFDGVPVAARRQRALLGVAMVVLIVAVTAVGSQLYFQRWHLRMIVVDPQSGRDVGADVPRREPHATRLWFSKVLNGIESERPVLVLETSWLLQKYLENVMEESVGEPGDRVFVFPNKTTGEELRSVSCARELPFTWIALDTPGQRERLAAIDGDFVSRAETRGVFRLLHVDRRKPGACSGAD